LDDCKTRGKTDFHLKKTDFATRKDFKRTRTAMSSCAELSSST